MCDVCVLGGVVRGTVAAGAATGAQRARVEHDSRDKRITNGHTSHTPHTHTHIVVAAIITRHHHTPPPPSPPSPRPGVPPRRRPAASASHVSHLLEQLGLGGRVQVVVHPLLLQAQALLGLLCV